MRRRLMASTTFSILGLAVAPGAAWAQQEAVAAAPPAALETVVVTAERRATNLQTTPVAVTSLGGADIRDRDIKDLKDLAGQAPGLAMPGLSSQRTVDVFYIRGIGEADTTQNPAVGIYIDDVYIPRAWGSIYEIPDISQVEVLRGPQGTLFGRNTSAGLINIHTQDPTTTPHGSLEVGYGTHNEVLVRGSVSGPLVGEVLTGSLGFVHHTRDGYTYDPTLDRNLNALYTDALRGKLRYQPNDKLQVELGFDAVNDRSQASTYAPLHQPNGAGGQSYDPDKVWVSVVPWQHLVGGGVSLHASYVLNDHITLKSITAGRGFANQVHNINDGGTSFIFNESYARVNDRDYQQEFQGLFTTDRLKAVAGVFLFHENYNQNRVAWSGGKTVNVGTAQYAISRTAVDSYAGYAQAEYNLVSKLFLTLGIRFSQDEAHYTNFGYSSATVFNTAGPQDLPAIRQANATGAYAIAAHDSWSAWTPRVEARYQWTPDLMTYLSYSKGYKAGGFDTRAATAATARQPFDPEYVKAYEGGVKAIFLENRLRANLAVFYNDYQDLQITAYDAANFVYRRINAAAAHTDGAELELTALPTPELQLGLSAAYLNSRYDEFHSTLPSNAAGVTTLVGLPLYWAPKWSLNLNGHYEHDVGFGTLRLAGVVAYRTKAYTDIYDTRQIASPAQVLINASLVWTHPNEKLSAGVYADNLTNNRSNQGGAYAPTSGPSQLVATGGQQIWANNPPRFVRFAVKYAF